MGGRCRRQNHEGEFHLPVGREVEFVFRSRDVIHGAYMPHFRAQMNTVLTCRRDSNDPNHHHRQHAYVGR